MKELAWILKLLVLITGLVLVLVGILGFGPGGQLSITLRLVGLIALVQGVLYYFPNEFLAKNYQRALIYTTLKQMPYIILTSAFVISILKDEIPSLLPKELLLLLLASLLAPISLWMFYRQKDCDHLLQRNAR